MDNFRIAVKSFIVNNNNELLLIKRRANDPHCPEAWEIPGGRLELGEDPFEGLFRETKEETGLDIEVLNPLSVKHFTRQDNQKITMIIFLAKPLTSEVKLSNEHTEHLWINIENVKSKLNEKFHDLIDIYEKHFEGNI
jgi:8-oxo-dGTP diphosphatase